MVKRKKNGGVPKGQKSMLNLVKSIGTYFQHPVVIHEPDFDPKKPNKNSQEKVRILSFSLIPACCWSARGSGATPQLAEESAANAMIDFFRQNVSRELATGLLKSQSESEAYRLFDQLAPLFEQFDKAIDLDYIFIKRVSSQFDMTSPAALRGREVRKRVLMNIIDSSVGYGPLKMKKKQQEVIVLDDDNVGDRPFLKSPDYPNSPDAPPISPAGSDDSVVILDGDSSPGEPRSSKSLSPELAEVRGLDNETRMICEEQTRKNIDARNNELGAVSASSEYFGEPNRSNQGPPEVLCSIPGTTGPQFAEDSSDEDEEEGPAPAKRARIEEEQGDVIVLNVSSSSGNGQKQAGKDSDEEIGDIVDEWDELDDEKEQHEEPSTTTENEPKNGFYDGEESHKEFIEKRHLPANYQAKTIGVVFNEPLAQITESYVREVASHNLESLARMSKLGWDHYINNAQSDPIYRRKMRAQSVLFARIQQAFPTKEVSLKVTGSTVNGCGSYNSDMDLCLCYPTNGFRGAHFDDFYCDRVFSTKILKKIQKAVGYGSQWHRHRIVKSLQLVPAKVPIIKLMLNGEFDGIDIDINVNNIAGIYNSHLTHYYSSIDARFPSLALLVKHWAMVEGVSNAQDGYLNSYSIILLVVHFLQCGVSPAILPNLQYLFPDKFDRKCNINELLLFGNIADKLPVSPPNTWSLGELLIGFFHYYANFNFQHFAISVRSAQIVPRSSLPRDTAHFPMFIEEPYDAINTARTVRMGSHLNNIKRSFRVASAVFASKHGFKLSDLGVNVIERD